MATTPSVESSANTAGSAIESAANTAGSAIKSAANTAGSAIKSAANASVDWVKASLTDYTFTGYGVVSRGSSVKMFMGTDQQFFLGGKNAMTIGTSNTFTAGIKTDVMVGPAVSMGIAFSGWDATKGVGFQSGHLTAKYDFSSNKAFAFQIAEEGSSNYVTQSKFICEKGFQAVGGFQPAGQLIYSAYKSTISSMGKVVAVTNFLMSIQQIAQTLESPELKKGETLTGARELWAQILPGVVAGTSAGVITGAAIYAAIQRETNFKTLIHPQSVIDLTKSSVFLGALGNGLNPSQQDGASLTLTKGKATLGSRMIGLGDLYTPYTEKFDGFNTKPTAAIEIDPNEIRSYANYMSIAAGGIESSDPAAVAVQKARKAHDLAIKKAKDLSEEAYKAIKIPLGFAARLVPGAEDAQEAAAVAARDRVLDAGTPAILTARAALETALAYYKVNPSLFLSAGSATGVSLSKIEARAPNFNVISPSISLSDTPIPLRGLFVKKLPPSIELVQSPASKISMDTTGSIALNVNPTTSMTLRPTGIVIKLGVTSINMGAVVTTINSGGTKIKLAMGQVMVGNGLKVIG